MVLRSSPVAVIQIVILPKIYLVHIPVNMKCISYIMLIRVEYLSKVFILSNDH